MNVRRGLFRLWIVGAVIFAIAVSCVSYGEIKAEFETAAATSKLGPMLNEPQKDVEAGSTDVTKLSNAELIELYKKSQPNPWAKVGVVAAIAFGIPLAVLILGASLVWAFSGFAATRSEFKEPS
jgi:hypothetical protein